MSVENHSDVERVFSLYPLCRARPCKRHALPGKTHCARHARKDWARVDDAAYKGIPGPGSFYDTCVYVVRAGEDGAVKIGLAKNVDDRLKGLQTGNGSPLVLLATIQGGAKLERALHAALAEYRRHGEWFDWCAEIATIVALARAGQFQPIEFFAFNEIAAPDAAFL